MFHEFLEVSFSNFIIMIPGLLMNSSSVPATLEDFDVEKGKKLENNYRLLLHTL